MPDGTSFRGIYRALYEENSSGFVRFQGIGTDGGVDSSGSRQMLYWVRTAVATQFISAAILSVNSYLTTAFYQSDEILDVVSTSSDGADWNHAG